MNNGERYDLIVVGLGAMGAAALFHAARAGLNVLGIDRYDPPHKFGSSHAHSRVTRLAVAEGEQYLPFVARSHDLWREIEAETGEQILFQSGACIINPAGQSEDERWGDFVTESAELARANNIAYELPSVPEFNERFPNLILDNQRIYFEPTGGVALPEVAISTQLQLAHKLGAETLVNSLVTSVEPTPDGSVAVTVGNTVYSADKAVVTTGGWFGELAPAQDAAAVTVTRQVVYWFEPKEPAVFSAEHFPAILWAGADITEYMAIFPMPPGTQGLKMMGEQFAETTTAADLNREVSQQEIDSFYQDFVSTHVRGVKNNCIDATVCMYTNTVDDHFLVDTHPNSEAIMYASPCSGHGFKHSTALAEAIVQKLTTSQSTLSLSTFKRMQVA